MRINKMSLGITLGILALSGGCDRSEEQAPAAPTKTATPETANTADGTTADPESLGMAAAPLQALGADMRAIVDGGERAAIVSLVSRHGKIVHLQAYGMADREANRPVTVDTMFRMCSMTRPLTAMAALILYEQGELDINAPVGQYLPMFATTHSLINPKEPTTEPATTPITVQQAFTHTTGYGYGGEYPDGIGITQEEITEAPSLMESMQRLARYPTLHQPGARWQYGFSTDILGALVEAIGREPYEDFVKTRIFEPLGMTQSVFRPNGENDPRFVKAYRFGDDGELEDASPRMRNICFQMDADEAISAGGGLAANVMDYWRLMQMLLNRGELDGARILQPETVDLMTRNHLREEQGPLWWYQPERIPAFKGYGYGFQVGVRLAEGEHSHPGSPEEFLWGGLADTTFFVDEREGIVAIALAQFFGPPSDMGERLRQRVYESLKEASP